MIILYHGGEAGVSQMITDHDYIKRGRRGLELEDKPCCKDLVLH